MGVALLIFLAFLRVSVPAIKEHDLVLTIAPLVFFAIIIPRGFLTEPANGAAF